MNRTNRPQVARMTPQYTGLCRTQCRAATFLVAVVSTLYPNPLGRFSGLWRVRGDGLYFVLQYCISVPQTNTMSVRTDIVKISYLKHKINSK